MYYLTTEPWDSDPVLKMIDAYTDLYPDEAFGFAHIVLDDYNLSDSHINWCLNEYNYDGVKFPQTIAFLEFLLTIPEELRDAQ